MGPECRACSTTLPRPISSTQHKHGPKTGVTLHVPSCPHSQLTCKGHRLNRFPLAQPRGAAPEALPQDVELRLRRVPPLSKVLFKASALLTPKVRKVEPSTYLARLP
eukprot:5300816-Amphidinium_carterae.1